MQNQNNAQHSATQLSSHDQHPQIDPSQVQQNEEVELIINGLVYKVIWRLFREEQILMNLTCFYWLQVLVFDITLIFLNSYPISLRYSVNYMPMFAGKTSVLFATIICLLFYRRLVKAQVLFFLLNLLAYCFVVTIFFGKQINYQTIASILFVTVQTLVQAFYFKNTNNLVLYSAFSIQLILIAAKSDGFLETSWTVALSLGIFLAATSLLLGFIKLLNAARAFSNQQMVRLQMHESIFDGLFDVGMSLELTAIIIQLCLANPYIILSLSCTVCHVLAILLFHLKYETQIIVYNAKRRQLVDPQWIKFEKVQKQIVLYRLSTNWYSLKPREQSQKEDNQENQQLSDCAVCLSSPSELVWMPCGHLFVCKSCGQDLLTSFKFQCVLCKTKAENIYFIDEKDVKTSKEHCNSRYNYKIYD